jgi:hypothetical protein
MIRKLKLSRRQREKNASKLNFKLMKLSLIQNTVMCFDYEYIFLFFLCLIVF